MKRTVLAGGFAALVWISGQAELSAQAPGSRMSRLVQGIGPSGGVIPSGRPNARAPGGQTSGDRVPVDRAPTGRTPNGRAVAGDERNVAPIAEQAASAEPTAALPWYKRLNPFAKTAPAPASAESQVAPVIKSAEPAGGRSARPSSRTTMSRRAQGTLDDDQPGSLFGYDRVRNTAEQQFDRQLDRAEQLRDVAERNGNEQLKNTADQLEERAASQYAQRVEILDEKRTRLVKQTEPVVDQVESYFKGVDAEQLPPDRGVDATATESSGVADEVDTGRRTRSDLPTRDPVDIDFSRARFQPGQFDREYAPQDDPAERPRESNRPVRTRRDVDRVSADETTDIGEAIETTEAIEQADSTLPPAARSRFSRRTAEPDQQQVERRSEQPVEQVNKQRSNRLTEQPDERPSEQPAEQPAAPRTWRQKFKSWFGGQE